MLTAFLLWFPFAVVRQDKELEGKTCEIMIIVKKELLIENEIKIMDGLAKKNVKVVIFGNFYVD